MTGTNVRSMSRLIPNAPQHLVRQCTVTATLGHALILIQYWNLLILVRWSGAAVICSNTGSCIFHRLIVTGPGMRHTHTPWLPHLVIFQYHCALWLSKFERIQPHVCTCSKYEQLTLRCHAPLNLEYSKVQYSRRLLETSITSPVHSPVQSRVQLLPRPLFLPIISYSIKQFSGILPPSPIIIVLLAHDCQNVANLVKIAQTDSTGLVKSLEIF